MKKKYVDMAIEQTVELCKIPSPSGFTKLATDHLINEFKGMGYKPTSSRKNSILVDIGGEGNPIVLAAHVDTLGAMVRAIKPNGRLRITKIGGYPENNIEGEKKIGVTTSLKDDCITVGVCDSGPGVPLALKEKIFDPFYTTKNGGTGIGLSLSKRIIEDHNGSLDVYSCEWGGAEFRIEIPIDEGEC